MAEEFYQSDYIKIVPKEPVKYIGEVVHDLQHARLSFGFFDFQGIIYPQKRKSIFMDTTGWVVLKFNPCSKDLNYDSRYVNRRNALKAALKYLDGKGFNAKAFDLELLIDNIEVR